jgi:hypothetical protein
MRREFWGAKNRKKIAVQTPVALAVVAVWISSVSAWSLFKSIVELWNLEPEAKLF